MDKILTKNINLLGFAETVKTILLLWLKMFARLFNLEESKFVHLCIKKLSVKFMKKNYVLFLQIYFSFSRKYNFIMNF